MSKKESEIKPTDDTRSTIKIIILKTRASGLLGIKGVSKRLNYHWFVKSKRIKKIV